MQKNESRHRPYTLHKSELKMDHRPKFKTKTTKLLEKNIDALGFCDAFLDTTPKT